MTGELIARQRLTDAQRQAMLRILAANFSNITPKRFAADLAEKNWVILIRDDACDIVGFSTLLLYQSTFEGAPIAVVYSGDTIIQQDAWGSAALPRTWIHAVWQWHRETCPALPLYWLLITSGFRTYRFLTVFWRTFYPSCRAPTPPRLQRLLEQLASQRFGGDFLPDAGIVRLGQPLRSDLLAIPPAKLQEPDIAFFVHRNPGYINGDELACLAELSPANLTPAGWRMVHATPAAQATPAAPQRN